MSFKDRALPMAMLGVPVIRIQPKSKIPMDKAWQTLATTDVDKILAWDSETPGANCACVATLDGVCFFETDEDGVIDRFEKETGESFKTFTVQSRPGRYHFYFTQTVESRACGSITQKEIPFGSFRQDRAYVISANSIHPTTGLPYTIYDSSPIIPAPSGLVAWLISQRAKAQTSSPSLQGNGPIPLGQHDVTLTAIAGKLRQDGLEREEIEAVLMRHLERCEGRGSDGPEMVKKIAKSVCRYPAGDSGPTVLIAGKLPGQNVTSARAEVSSVEKSHSGVENLPADYEIVEKSATGNALEYPYWCWNGTLYEDFATICGENNVVPKEYFIEAVKTVVGAICGHRIFPFKTLSQESRFYTILIGPGGSGKSSAARWSKDLFIGTGMLYELSQSGAFSNIGCAQGSFASSSGLIKNGFAKNSRILQYYDEATTMIEKFGITGSGDSFLDAVNQLYESGAMPQLTTKDDKGQSPTAGRLVHNSILGCTTKEKWAASFIRTNSESSGFFQRLNIITNDSDERVANFNDPDLSVLRDQFVRKIQPLEYQEVIVSKTPEASDIFEKWYSSKRVEWKELPNDVTGRVQVMVQRNASHLAWLMSGDDITPDPEKALIPIEVICDEDIMERAIALAEYQVEARKGHQPVQGRNDQAMAENLIRVVVQRSGYISRSKLQREIRADRYGVHIFDRAINNLCQEGLIKIGVREGEAKRGRKAQVISWVND
jgi:Bifunctional DNA primase/polymerase, N-terminal